MPQEEKRVKDFPRAVGGVQTDDYIPVDGTTKGTRKITVDDIIEAAVSGLDTDANTVKAAINELKANAFGTIALTKAEYDALPASKLTDGIAYYIYDTDPDVDNAVWTKVGRETLTIGSSCSDGINQLKQSLSHLGELIWTNQNPSNTFAGQTLNNLDLSKYRFLLVVYKRWINVEDYEVNIIFKDKKCLIKSLAEVLNYRSAECTNTSITWSDSNDYQTYGDSTKTVQNNRNVPYKIFGMF